MRKLSVASAALPGKVAGGLPAACKLQLKSQDWLETPGRQQ